MRTLAIYALEVLACSGVLLAAYAILLDRRVRFGWCRAYLLASPLLAAIIPLLRIPVWPGEVVELTPTISLPATEWTAEVVAKAAPGITPEAVCLAIYLLGAGLVAGVMLWQVMSIRRLWRGAAITRTERFTLVRTPQQIVSFSFFRSIYIWDQIPAGELRVIIAHEASHIAHRHSAERVAMECMKAALWWNPFVWLTARRLTEAEEFEADSDVLAEGHDIEHYMKTIFRQLFGYSPEIANGLRDSLTKKRFKMMTTKTSGRYSLLRLAGTLPVVTGLLCAFSFTTRAAEIRIAETAQSPAAETTLRDAAKKNVSVTVFRNGKPLPGAIVLIGGSTAGAVTDKEGTAQIAAAPGNELVVSHVGCRTRKIRVSDTSDTEHFEIALETETTQLTPVSVTPNAPKPAADQHAADAGQEQKTAPATNGAAAAGIASAPAEDEPFLIAEKMPSFRGGDLNTFRIWVQEHLQYPAEAVKRKIQGRVILNFTVEKEGSISDIEILRSPDKLLADEACRVIASLPAGAWTPGEQRGEKVRVKYTLPLDFRMEPTKTTEKPASAAVSTPAPASTPASAPASASAEDEVFLITEVMPSFRGGDLNTFRIWVQEHLQYPAEAVKRKIQGRVILNFTVEKEGSISDIEILRSPDKLLADEVRRVIGSMPADSWTPGRQRGQNVRVKLTIPVDFRPNQPAGTAIPQQAENTQGSIE
ncbi:TonB family protein [Alistipes sp.]|uniref:TonB family protein n=1 Tax=Alistipes sp. TaxID=1872444 RepID=UPI0025BCD31A|nr:TonB family protein [Alistipes sp.]